jgi:serine/threonine protein kinase
MPARLMVIAGPDLGRTFELEAGRPLQFGRSAAAGARLTDPAVARVHCEVEFDGERAVLVNVAAAGTLVNGHPAEEHQLKAGDRVRVGDTELCFVPPDGNSPCLPDDLGYRPCSPVPSDDSIAPPPPPTEGPITPTHPRVASAAEVVLPPGIISALPEERPLSGGDSPKPGTAPQFRGTSLFGARPAGYPFLSPPRDDGELGWLGNYRVLRLLGEGGMGAVFTAEDSHLQRRVALKVMKPEFTADLEGRQRFLTEARAMAALPPDYVVLVYQVGLEGDVPFLAMEHLEGETLEAWLKRVGRASVLQAVRIVNDVAAGLAMAHDRGVVHRDIKPSNLWLDTTKRRVKLLDFGLARHATRSTGLTRQGDVLGTPDYMAPEQAHGEPVDARTDLYAVGVLLYRMLTGRLPFEKKTPMATMLALTTEEAVPVRSLNPEVPEDLAALVTALMSKDPAGRPASARHITAVLTAVKQRAQAGRASSLSIPVPPPPGVAQAEPVRPRDMDAAFAVEYRAAEWAARKKGLVEVRVRSTGRTVTVEKLSSLPSEPFVVQTLNLASRPIADAELVLLSGLRGLQLLDLTNTPVSDLSLRFLGTLRTLRMLILAYTKVSDSGIRYLTNLASLRELYLMGTGVTPAGVAVLKKSLPRCEITA